MALTAQAWFPYNLWIVYRYGNGKISDTMQNDPNGLDIA